MPISTCLLVTVVHGCGAQPSIGSTAFPRLLDIALAIPVIRIRFSVEALLRMIPGIGDVAASALSCWVL